MTILIYLKYFAASDFNSTCKPVPSTVGYLISNRYAVMTLTVPVSHWGMTLYQGLSTAKLNLDGVTVAYSMVAVASVELCWVLTNSI